MIVSGLHVSPTNLFLRSLAQQLSKVRGGTLERKCLHDLARPVVAIIPNMIVLETLEAVRRKDAVGATKTMDTAPLLAHILERMCSRDTWYTTVSFSDVDWPEGILVALTRCCAT